MNEKDEIVMNDDDDYVYTYDIEEIDECVDKINRGIIPAMLDDAMKADIKHRAMELKRIIDEEMDDEEIGLSRARMLANKIEQNKRKATKRDVLVIQLTDEQRNEIHQQMDGVVVRDNWRLRYHKSDDEIYDSAERKSIYTRLSKLQKQYYHVDEWIDAMKTIMEAVEYSLDHDYPMYNHDTVVEMWNSGKIAFKYCPIPQLFTSWTTMVTDPETLKGIMCGEITVETSSDKLAKSKPKRDRSERVGIVYDYAVVDPGEFNAMRNAHLAGYDTPVSPIIRAMRGTFNRFSLPENNYFVSMYNDNSNDGKREMPMSFDWLADGAGKEYFRLVNGKKETTDDIVDFVAECNNRELGPQFRNGMGEFLDSMSRSPEQNMVGGGGADLLSYNAIPSELEQVNEKEIALEKAIMDQMIVIQ